jgi:hypothetical protein
LTLECVPGWYRVGDCGRWLADDGLDSEGGAATNLDRIHAKLDSVHPAWSNREPSKVRTWWEGHHQLCDEASDPLSGPSGHFPHHHHHHAPDCSRPLCNNVINFTNNLSRLRHRRITSRNCLRERFGAAAFWLPTYASYLRRRLATEGERIVSPHPRQRIPYVAVVDCLP